MTKENIQKYRKETEQYILGSRLHDAFRMLRAMTPTHAWRITGDIDKTEEAYALMLRYAIDGAVDPHRREVYAGIVDKLYSLLDRIVREAAEQDSSTLYFNNVRYERMQLETLTQLVDAYVRMADRMSMFNRVASGDGQFKNDLMEKEQLERRIFNKVWTEYPLGSDSLDAVRAIFANDALPLYFKEYIVSALMLGALAYYEESRLVVLLDVYASAPASLSLKALCAAVIVMSAHCNRMNSSRVGDRIAALRESTAWSRDIKAIYLQLIRTRDTEKINRKVRDELIPQMLKLRPDIYNKINDAASVSDLSDMEENPEWQELLESSGIADKMKELSKIQEEGGDVMMSTFSHLKTYPFFNELPNWFLPFHIDHSAVAGTMPGNGGDTLAELIAATPFLCNSDKFSFALSVHQVPEAQRRMMLAQFDEQNVNFAAIQSAELSADEKARENIINKYVQDLYRFYKLFRRKGEFYDPFANPVNLIRVPLLAADTTDAATLQLVGEFYFKHGYYADSCELFKILSGIVPPDAALYQKLGYCYQQEGDIKEALKYYGQAELLNAESMWTLRRMAACYKLDGKPAQALEYLLRVSAKYPDDLTVALNIGHCLLELGRYAEAMKYYYKVEFIDSGSTRAWRPLAWCALLSRDFDTSRKYYTRVLSDAPSDGDYLNMGHLELATGHMREALNYYKLSAEADSDGMESLIKNLNADRKDLDAMGVDVSMVPLLVDSMLYSMT